MSVSALKPRLRTKWKAGERSRIVLPRLLIKHSSSPDYDDTRPATRNPLVFPLLTTLLGSAHSIHSLSQTLTIMSDSSRASPAPERDQQLLSVGKQCSHAACHLVDFLPFKCQHCQESFCQEHFKVDDHNCPKYDASKHNRVAPSCKFPRYNFYPYMLRNICAGPLCNSPVAIPPGQDPNIRMEQHFAKECSVMLGKAVKKSTPVCERGKCGKVLYAPIKCDVRSPILFVLPSVYSCTGYRNVASSSAQHIVSPATIPVMPPIRLQLQVPAPAPGQGHQLLQADC
jgi:hypothetical protein